MRTPSSPTWVFLALLPLAVLAAACNKDETGPGKDQPEQARASAPSEQRLMLNQGYSMLYKDASGIELAKLILYIKVETDAVNQIVTAISDFGGQMEKDLERIAKDYPGVRIDLDPLPEMEKRKRADVSKERALSFAPFVGRKGGDFERTLLLSMSAILSQESHLCKVMADEEPDPGLKKYLLVSKKQFDDLYDRVVALLNSEYFKGGVSAPEKH